MRILGLVWTMIVARLLTPEEIGTFAIASALVMVLSEFKLLGAGAYLVREKEINNKKIKSALGLTVLISWGLGIAIFISAPFIADFYELSPVETIFRVLALSFILAPFISIPTAIYQRGYSFKILFYSKISAKIIGLSSAIIFILLGFSYYSLAFGQVTIVIVEFFILFVFWPKGSPRLPSFYGLKPIVSFGIYSSFANILKKATVTIPDLVIGKMGTTHQVAIYSRGLGFVEFVSQTLMMGVTPVALPYLSETQRKGGDIGAAYIRASVLLGGLVWPVLAVVSVASLPAIRLFFGDQWDSAAPLTSILVLWAMLRTMNWLSDPLLIANGNEKFLVLKEVIVFIPFLLAVIYSYQFGLEAIAIAFVAAGSWDFLVSIFIISRKVRIKIFEMLIAWLPNLAVSVVCYSVTYALSMLIDFSGENFWNPILLIAAVLPPVYMISLKLFGHPLYEELMNIIKAIFKKVGN